MSSELASLTAKFKAEDLALQISWLSAAVVDGDVEATKKAAIQEARIALKTKFVVDKATIISKYAE